MLHTSFSVNRSAFRKNTQLKNSVNKGDVFFKAAVIEIEVPLTSAEKKNKIAMLLANPPSAKKVISPRDRKSVV